MSTMKLNYVGPAFNDFSALDLPTVKAQIAKRFAKNTEILTKINLDVQDATESRGSSVDVQLPIDLGAAKDMPKNGESTPTELNVQTARVNLDNHIYQEFKISDRELSEMQQGGTIPDGLRAAVDSVSMRIKEEVLNLHAQVYNTAGGGGSKFDLSTLVAARTKMTKMGVEKAERHLALGAMSTGDILNANITNYATENPSAVEGELVRRAGFDLFEDENIEVVEGGANEAFPAAATVSAIVLASAHELAVSGVETSEVIEAGDRFKIAGSQRLYTVADFADNVITTVEALPALAGGEAITASTDADSYEANIAYHTSAFTAAFRSLSVPSGNPGGVLVQQITVPGTNIPLKLSGWYSGSAGASHWKVEALAGFAATRADAACLVLPTA